LTWNKLMRRLVKKTYLFFIFLAIFIYNAHMIIPHDHHQSDPDICQENSIPGKGAGHNHGFPSHCHIFNDMTPEKAVASLVLRHFHTTDIISGNNKASDILIIQKSWKINEESTELLVYSCLLENSSLRAPPVSC
jgi:hypothetical protein